MNNSMNFLSLEAPVTMCELVMGESRTLAFDVPGPHPILKEQIACVFEQAAKGSRLARAWLSSELGQMCGRQLSGSVRKTSCLAFLMLSNE